MAERGQVDGVFEKLDAGQSASFRKGHIGYVVPDMKRHVIECAGGICGADFPYVDGRADDEKEAGSERMRGPDEIAQVSLLTDSLYADSEITANCPYSFLWF